MHENAKELGQLGITDSHLPADFCVEILSVVIVVLCSVLSFERESVHIYNTTFAFFAMVYLRLWRSRWIIADISV